MIRRPAWMSEGEPRWSSLIGDPLNRDAARASGQRSLGSWVVYWLNFRFGGSSWFEWYWFPEFNFMLIWFWDTSAQNADLWCPVTSWLGVITFQIWEVAIPIGMCAYCFRFLSKHISRLFFVTHLGTWITVVRQRNEYFTKLRCKTSCKGLSCRSAITTERSQNFRHESQGFPMSPCARRPYCICQADVFNRARDWGICIPWLRSANAGGFAKVTTLVEQAGRTASPILLNKIQYKDSLIARTVPVPVHLSQHPQRWW